MTMMGTSRRVGLTVLAAIAIGLGSAACGPTKSPDLAAATPPSPAGPDGAGSLGGAPDGGGPPAPGPTDLSPNYPSTPEAYSKAVVAAWVQDQPVTLASLTDGDTNTAVTDLLPTVNDQWTYMRCDGTAGSSYCSFANVNGDLFILRITHSLLSKAHAAIEGNLDRTEYPNDGTAYVKEFVAAWQFGNTARMLVLSTPAVAAKVKQAPSSPTYPPATCCGGGLLQVKVHWTGLGSSALFDVGTTKLGGPHAILDYTPGQLPISS